MKAQINALTSTRAFAAIIVFIFHSGRSIAPFDKIPWLFNNGNTAVSYFFVLSGFVLYISHAENKLRYFNFIKKRLVRIAPAYLLALGLFILAKYYIYGDTYTSDETRQIVYSILFIQSHFPHYATCLNSAAWSICAEMLFYVTFPFLLLLQIKKIRLFMLLTILIFIITRVSIFLFFKWDDKQTDNWDFFLYTPVIHFHQFLIGMAGGYIFKKIDPARKKYAILPLVWFVVILLLLMVKPDTVVYSIGLLLPVFMLLIISIAVTNPRILNIKPLVFLGEISYGIYILQFPVRVFTEHFNSLYKIFSETGFFYFSLAILILAATLSYYLLEKPLLQKFATQTLTK